MNLPPISPVKQWADYQLNEETVRGGVLDAVARFVVHVLASPGLSADTLVAIQRSFEPIDDDGTLRMEVKRSDVVALLQEVLRLRATMPACPEGQGEECRDLPAQNADDQPQQSEPESTETTESVTSDADSATTVLRASRSHLRYKTGGAAIATRGTIRLDAANKKRKDDIRSVRESWVPQWVLTSGTSGRPFVESPRAGNNWRPRHPRFTHTQQLSISSSARLVLTSNLQN